jgi:hypothetical protein
MSDIAPDFWHDATPTLEQYRRLNLTRPLTDRPVGYLTEARRSASALRSRAVEAAYDRLDPATWNEPRIGGDGPVMRSKPRNPKPENAT